MEQRNLGNSGLLVSVVGIGCNNFGGRTDAETSAQVIHKALDMGVTLFDTSDTYGNRGGSETILGNVLGSHRQNIVLASKFGWAMDDIGQKKGASRRYILKAVHDSLKRLKTDYLDLYQLHRPDPLTPIEETLRTLNDLIRMGMVRYIGCSNLPAWQVADAYWTAKSLGLEGFVSSQDEYNLLNREVERELVPALKHFGMGLLPYFPLASGMLTGKYRRDQALPEGARLTKSQALADQFFTDKNWEIVDRLQNYADAKGRSMLELAMGWMASQPQVASVIAGATKPEQVESNVKAVNWRLSAQELAEVAQLLA